MSKPATPKKPKTKPSAASSGQKILFIVESPNKVKTIEKILGDTYLVRASIGHIADIPERKGSVDVDNDFAAVYELTEKGKTVIAGLKKDMKRCSEVILATDADREGEMIAAHIVQFLQPKVPVKRVTFHAVTKDAIEAALLEPRDIDDNLVAAALTRRILDRLFGFEISDVTRQKVRQNTTAGRVQSPALRLVVERELERRDFMSAGYFNVVAQTATTSACEATLSKVDGNAIATGKDFDATGTLINPVTVVEHTTAARIADELTDGTATLVVQDIATKRATRHPQPPLTMSSLYQEAGNRLGMTSKEVEMVSSELFEKGHITYPRTDSPVHNAGSRQEIRAVIAQLYGQSLVAQPERFSQNKRKNAQGAHEAIRPTRLHKQTVGGLTPRQQMMYRLIWQRTIASQMISATGSTVTVTFGSVGGRDQCEFTVSGTTYTEPGFRRVYTSYIEGQKIVAILPDFQVGETVPVATAEAIEHHTLAPARFTEASLVKELELLGIGRPSTYGSIITKLRDRYVWTKDKERALIPTVTAFAVNQLLVTHFPTLLDYDFTSAMEESLDAVADDGALRHAILSTFYFGDDNDQPGLHRLVVGALATVQGKDMYAIHLGVHPETGEEIILRAGRMFGKAVSPYMECGDIKVSIPDQTMCDELTTQHAVDLLGASKAQQIGEIDDVPVFVKTTTTGAYFQWGITGNFAPKMKKPITRGMLKRMDPALVTLDDAVLMLSLPRTVGTHADTGEIIVADIGKFGAYLRCGDDTRSLKDDELIFSISESEARALFAIARKPRRGKKE